MALDSIAFIPDGNRRFSQKAGISLLKSYQLGTKKAWQVCEWLGKYAEIKFGTFWSLSLENFKRKREIPVLFRIFEKELEKVKTSGLFEREGIRLKFIGRKSVFPARLQKKILEAEKFTEGFSKKHNQHCARLQRPSRNNRRRKKNCARLQVRKNKPGLD